MDSDNEPQPNRRSGRGRGRGRGRPPGRPAKKTKKKSEKSIKDQIIENNVKDIEKSVSDWEEKRGLDLDLNVKNETIEFDENIDSEALTSHPISFVSSSSKLLHRNEPLNWKYRVNLIGEKVVNPRIHCCEKCHLPILIYGRMIACKHVFCLKCAKQHETVCPRCEEKVLRVEKSGLGTVYMCQTESCKRTYLSQRDLQAHIQHRHVRRQTSSSALIPSNNPNVITSASISVKEVSHSNSTVTSRSITYNSSFQSPIPVVSSRSNLITVPIQEEVNSSLNPMTQTVNSQNSMIVSSQQPVSNYGPQQSAYGHHNPHMPWPSMPNTNTFGYRPAWPPMNPYNHPYTPRPYYQQ